MSTDAAFAFDRMVEELQEAILKDARAYYSPQVVEGWLHPQNMGRMGDANAYAVVRGWCGDTMEIYLRVSDGQIVEATFMTDGCGPTVACGSKLTSMVRDLPLGQAQEIIPDDLLVALGGLPDESLHCAQLAVNTLHEALASYQRLDRDDRMPEEVVRQAGELMRQGYH